MHRALSCPPSGPLVALSDAHVQKLAELSHLSFVPGTPEFVAVQRDTAQLLSLVTGLRGALAATSLSETAQAAMAAARASS